VRTARRVLVEFKPDCSRERNFPALRRWQRGLSVGIRLEAWEQRDGEMEADEAQQRADDAAGKHVTEEVHAEHDAR
jgi:hypothetical protein